VTCQLRRGLLAAALLLALPAAGFAHDPGLSSLDVRVKASEIIAELSLASADASMVGGHEALALGALDVRIDGQLLRGTVDEISNNSAQGVRIVVRYPRRPGSQLTVASNVPARLARGHRELVSIRADDGLLLAEHMLDASSSDVAVDLGATTGGGRSALWFLRLGVEHILAGYDHLLFLAALLLVARERRELVTVVTAFTIAHSVTLAAAVLGWIDVPAWIVEPFIAASIVYVGIENLVRREPGVRWKLTFAFGLIHGFGFAGALRELGIGADGVDIAVPLAAFNVGVEAGQLAVAMLLLPLLIRLRDHPAVRARLIPACSCFVVLAGGYWLIERTIA